MSQPPAPTAYLKATGMLDKNKKHYAETFNPTDGVPMTGVPVCPKGVSKKGEEFWNTTIPCLYQMGMLSYTDSAELEALLFAYEELQKTMKAIKKFDKENDWYDDADLIKTRKHLSTLWHNAQEEFNKLAFHFGLTPSDRRNLPIKMMTQTKEEDPLSALGL